MSREVVTSRISIFMEENPASEETARAIVPILACVLNQLCSRNDKVGYTMIFLTKYDDFS